jgi:prefoldin subunit 5
MGKETIDKEEIKQKMNEYSAFLREVLRPDYESLHEAENEILSEILEYEGLRNRLEEGIATEDNMMVDLGLNKIRCRAELVDPEMVFVHVGMGFHVQFTVPEAIQYIEKRLFFLREQKLKYWHTKLENVQVHIRSSTFLLDELSKELER